MGFHYYIDFLDVAQPFHHVGAFEGLSLVNHPDFVWKTDYIQHPSLGSSELLGWKLCRYGLDNHVALPGNYLLPPLPYMELLSIRAQFFQSWRLFHTEFMENMITASMRGKLAGVMLACSPECLTMLETIYQYNPNAFGGYTPAQEYFLTFWTFRVLNGLWSNVAAQQGTAACLDILMNPASQIPQVLELFDATYSRMLLAN